MSRPRKNAFTLVELLIVIGIIVLVSVIAVPAFKTLTGGRSTEAAQNNVSAVLARARTEALGLQEPRGILFYRDLDSQRVTMALVRATNGAEPYELDLVEDRDTVLLPNGVGIQFLDNCITTGTAKKRIDDGYIGFNTFLVPGSATDQTTVAYGRVILFDGQGRLVNDVYQFRLRYPIQLPSQPLPRMTAIAELLYNKPGMTSADTGAPDVIFPAAKVGTVEPQRGAIGFVLFDDADFASAHGGGRSVAKSGDSDCDVQGTTNGNGPFAPEEEAEEKWLDENAVPVLVNRYNGTLVKGE